MTFANPWVLTLLVLPILFILWQIARYRTLYPTLQLPNLQGVSQNLTPIRGYIKKYLFALRVLAVGLLILALARPQTSMREENVQTEGIDIVIALDISGSMNALDFNPNRLEAAKRKAADFVGAREHDRLGLVVFAGESFTQCPLTTDHAMYLTLLRDIKQGLIEDGTAIGMGLANAVLRLKESDAKSKVVILLTDGVNNQGQIDPLTATETAVQFGVRVYTVGVGSNGRAPILQRDRFGRTVRTQMDVELDEELLGNIAQRTGGQYFRASNTEALGKVYEEIDRMEKTRMEVTRITRYQEEFHWFLLLAGILLLFEWILRYTLVRTIP
ncbi:MAG: VWA domain-containing protein [Bacteroidota bacterium]